MQMLKIERNNEKKEEKKKMMLSKEWYTYEWQRNVSYVSKTSNMGISPFLI